MLTVDVLACGVTVALVGRIVDEGSSCSSRGGVVVVALVEPAEVAAIELSDSVELPASWDVVLIEGGEDGAIWDGARLLDEGANEEAKVEALLEPGKMVVAN